MEPDADTIANERQVAHEMSRSLGPEHSTAAILRCSLCILAAIAPMASVARADTEADWKFVSRRICCYHRSMGKPPSVAWGAMYRLILGAFQLAPVRRHGSRRGTPQERCRGHGRRGLHVSRRRRFRPAWRRAPRRNVFQGIFEVYGTYRFDLGQTKLDAYAGARIWDIDVDVDVRAGAFSGEFGGGDTWVDPVLGARLQQRIAPSWRLQVQSDVGGFGIDGASDFTWNVMGGIAYDGWESTSVFLLYRALGVDFDSAPPARHRSSNMIRSPTVR